MDSGFEKGFVDVDVPQAGDEPLIEQGVFNRAGGSRESLGELGGAEGQRLGADEVRFFGLAKPPDSAKATRISEADFSAGRVFELDRASGCAVSARR